MTTTYTNLKSTKKVLILCDSYRISFQPSSDRLSTFFNSDNVARVQKIIKKFESYSTIKVVAMDEKIFEQLKISKVPCQFYLDYEGMNLWWESDELAIKLIREYNEFGLDSTYKRNFTYHGNSLWDLCELNLWSLFKTFCAYMLQVKNILDFEKPDVIAVIDPASIVARATTAVKNGIEIYSPKSSLLLFVKNYFDKKLKVVAKRIFDWLRFYTEYVKAWRRGLNYSSHYKIPETSKNKIILLTDVLRHIPMVLPWGCELVKKNQNELTIISFCPWPKNFNECNFNFQLFSQFDSIKKKFNVILTRKNIMRSWRHIEKELSRNPFMKFNGVSIFNLLKNDIYYVFDSHVGHFVKYIELTEKIISSFNPKVVVVMDGRSWPGKTFLSVCKNHKKPTIILQHGLHADSAFWGPTDATKMAVFGEFTKNVLVKRGVESSKIVITGGPQWDIALKPDSFQREEFCEKFGLAPEKGIILLATDIIFDRNIGYQVLKGVIKAVREFPQMQLLVRAHPTEPIELYKSIAREIGENDLIIFKKQQDYDSLKACDVLITQYSTVGLEAMILKKPVLTINLKKRKEIYPYASSGAALGVYRAEDILPALREIIHNNAVRSLLAQNVEKFVFEHAYKQDGKASERVVQVMMEMCNS